MNDPHSFADVKPCPFCGHQGVTVYQGENFRWRVAICDACGAQAPDVRHSIKEGQASAEAMADADRRAIEAWNTRT
jgi:Lar family restriction alleviation protein